MKPRKRAHGGQRPAPSRGPRPGSDGTVWLYGTHAVLAALANRRRDCRRLILAARGEDALADRAAAAAAAGGHTLRPEAIDRHEIDHLLPPGAVHQGIALQAAPLPDVPLAAVGDDESAVAVVLDQATDPQNVGAVLRSAAAFGARAVIVQDRHSPPESGAMAKAASGALEIVPLIRVTNLARALDDLKERGFWCVGLDGTAEANLSETDLGGRRALVLGAEGSGLRRLTREKCDLLARLPITEAVESLNLSNAAAIALYETARRP